MNENEIKSRYQELNEELKDALSTMEYSDMITIIRNQIKELQDICPHNNGAYNFTTADKCPFCGKKFRE